MCGEAGPPGADTVFTAERGSRPLHGVSLVRPLAPGSYALGELAPGLSASPPLQRIFGARCAEVCEKAKVELVPEEGYMWVSNDDGTLFVSAPYWNGGPELGIYLDLCHELVHVDQHHRGLDLYDRRHKYVERPTELEAYRVAVEEARRLGMSETDLAEFLYVPWISHDEHAELCAACGVPYVRSREADAPPR